MTNKEFEQKCYHAYQLDWMISHGYTLADLFNEQIDAAWDEFDPSEYHDENGNITPDYAFDHDEFKRRLLAGNDTFTDDRGFGGSLWACEDEFLTHEFLDPYYMAHLFKLMPPCGDYLDLYKATTGLSITCDEISVPTSIGQLTASAYDGKTQEPGQPGICITFAPKGSDDIMDVACVRVCEDTELAEINNENPGDIVIMTYADPYEENYTRKDVLDKEQVFDAFGIKTE